MLQNFDTDLDRLGVSRIVVRPGRGVPVEKSVHRVLLDDGVRTVRDEIITVPKLDNIGRTAHTIRSEAEWSWQDLREYVVARVAGRARESNAEVGIFKAFLKRWPDGKAAAIARYALETSAGRWAGRDVTVFSFCVKSDPYFADPIAHKLGILD